MSENPYAAPVTTESEIPSTLYWQTDGAGILAKSGSVLPEVDLETGAIIGEMRPLPLIFNGTRWGTVLFVSTSILAISFLRPFLDIDLGWLVWPLMIGIFLHAWTRNLKGGGPITITTFTETERSNRRSTRQRWRLFLSLGIAALLFAGPMLLPYSPARYGSIFAFGLSLLIALGVWRFLDRSKLRTEAGPPGWMRVSNIHPLAWSDLQRIEVEARNSSAIAPETARRKVFTSYFHKYPLRALLGQNWKNPLLVLAIAIMKWTRSARLQRETFHFSESSPLPTGEMHPVLRSAMDSWLATHPEWILARAECLPSPAGDVTVETLYLASPGLEHSLVITCVWIQQKPAAAKADHTFGTWIAGGKLIITTSQYLLPFSRPDVDAIEVSGTPEKIHTAHLARCAPFELDPPRDIMDLEARMTKDREEFSALLEAAGWHGPVRETF